MRTGITVDVNVADRARLEAIAADRNSPQKHVWRARIVLLTSEGVGTHEIMRRTGKSKTCLWRWQERFMHEGVDGLLHISEMSWARVQDASSIVQPGQPGFVNDRYGGTVLGGLCDVIDIDVIAEGFDGVPVGKRYRCTGESHERRVG